MGVLIMTRLVSTRKVKMDVARRTLVNKARRNRVRSFVRKVDEAVASGSKEASVIAFRKAQTEIYRAVTKGLWHINTAARKVSRLARNVKGVCT